MFFLKRFVIFFCSKKKIIIYNVFGFERIDNRELNSYKKFGFIFFLRLIVNLRC